MTHRRRARQKLHKNRCKAASAPMALRCHTCQRIHTIPSWAQRSDPIRAPPPSPPATHPVKGRPADDQLVRQHAHRPRVHHRVVPKVRAVLVVAGLVLVGAHHHLGGRRGSSGVCRGCPTVLRCCVHRPGPATCTCTARAAYTLPSERLGSACKARVYLGAQTCAHCTNERSLVSLVSAPW